MNIALLLTGNELMSGDTVDSNSANIAQAISACGFSVVHKVTVGDDVELLAQELASLSQRYAAVLVNGGLGPTVDDLTAEVVARVADVPVTLHAEAEAHVHRWCEARGARVNEANLKQAQLPTGCELLANELGSAVGFSVQHESCHILCTPGVPSELMRMLDVAVIPYLQAVFPQAKRRYIRRLKLFGVGESSLQQRLDDHFPDWPEDVVVGFRAGAPLLELKLEVGDERLLPLRDQCESQLLSLVGDFVVGENDQTLGEAVVNQLQASQRKLALAESCTSGSIAAQVTAVAGASTVFEAGIVCYSNAIKSAILGVSEATLQQHGAVSEAVVIEMASGAMQRSGADCAIAVSGIAGPGGGTAEKPVGTVWIAWGGADKLHARQFFYPVERTFFQTMVSALALDLLRRYLRGEEHAPDYFRFDRK